MFRCSWTFGAVAAANDFRAAVSPPAGALIAGTANATPNTSALVLVGAGTFNTGGLNQTFGGLFGSAASTLNIGASAVGLPGVLRVRSQANGGAGEITGNASSGRASLNLANSTLDVGQLSIEARAFEKIQGAVKRNLASIEARV